MRSITAKGRELATLLNPSMGTTHAILVTCSLICRHATTIARLAEVDCNKGLTPSQIRQDKRAEELIRSLVMDLPHVDGQPIRVEFQGDPRGATVKLIMPDGRGNSFCGGGRMCVPGS